MSRLTEQEIERNMQFAERAIAQPYLSGVRVSEAGKADLRKVAKGEITIDDAFRNLEGRLQHAATDKS